MIAISGKPIAMVYSLRMHGEANPLPVDNCFDAMRGYGRCHTTRNFEPYKAYGISEGDIALAYSGNQKVALRVGKQYKITHQQIEDPNFQNEWAAMEKHSGKELLTFRNKPEIWGLHFEPLGDYVDGQIVPFPAIEQRLATRPITQLASPINIFSGSDSPLGAALTNPTETAHFKGKIRQHYPVSFAGNPGRPANTTSKAEKYFQPKPAGMPYLSAEDAFQSLRHTVGKDGEVELMAQIIAAKLEQHPRLKDAISQNGGTAWLETCEHTVTRGTSRWEGKGRASPFISALIAGYERAARIKQTQPQTPTLTMTEPTPTRIDPESLAPHQVVVWGANTEGRHGKGLAKIMFGDYPHRHGTVGDRAVYARGEGYHQGRKGDSYAIVTKDLALGERSIPLSKIAAAIDRFLAFAKQHPDREFLVTPIGTGLAGYTPEEIAPLFQKERLPNVRLPQEFLPAAEKQSAAAALSPEQQLDRAITARYAMITAALLRYNQSTDLTGEHYRAAWDRETHEIRLYDKGSDAPKLVARYDRASQTYIATEPHRLTTTDTERLDKIDRNVKLAFVRDVQKSQQQELN